MSVAWQCDMTSKVKTNDVRLSRVCVSVVIKITLLLLSFLLNILILFLNHFILIFITLAESVNIVLKCKMTVYLKHSNNFRFAVSFINTVLLSLLLLENEKDRFCLLRDIQERKLRLLLN